MKTKLTAQQWVIIGLSTYVVADIWIGLMNLILIAGQ